MIHHIVLFRLKPEATTEQRRQMKEALEELKHRISQVLSIQVGPNFSSRHQGYDMMLVSSFQTRQDLEIYLNHPIHRGAVSTFVDPIKDGVIAGDLEVQAEQKE